MKNNGCLFTSATRVRPKLVTLCIRNQFTFPVAEIERYTKFHPLDAATTTRNVTSLQRFPLYQFQSYGFRTFPALSQKLIRICILSAHTATVSIYKHHLHAAQLSIFNVKAQNLKSFEINLNRLKSMLFTINCYKIDTCSYNSH